MNQPTAMSPFPPKPLRRLVGYDRNEVISHRPRADADDPDAATVARLVAGDGEALSALYDRYGRLTYAIAYRIVGEPELAEECVQDVFVALWRNASRYDPARALVSTWLCGIARNKALDAVRRRQRRPVPTEGVELEGTASDSADLAVAAADAVRVAEAMAALPPAQFEVLQLAHFEGLTQAEIAERLGLPLGTVKGRMRLALERMRTLARDLAPEGVR
jgi:RNA polymerase sigma-70 factor (ECF subfamily)